MVLIITWKAHLPGGEKKLHLMGGEQKLIKEEEFMQDCFLLWFLLAKKEKLHPLVKHDMWFPLLNTVSNFLLFHVNFGRNVAIGIIRNIIQFLYCSGAVIVNVKEVKNNLK